MKQKLKILPGWIGIGLITLLNAIWLFWGLGEAFYEGWGVPETPWLLFLTIPIAAMLFCFLAIKFPLYGGGLLTIVGMAFAAWWLIPGISTGFYSLEVLSGRLALSLGFSFVGVCLILDGVVNPKKDEKSKPWFIRNLRVILSIGIPLLTGLGVTAFNLPTVLTRVDDGIRSARLIDGNQVRLVWAPAGPGWNWKQNFGGYPSWDMLASYGIAPIGLEIDKFSANHAGQATMDKSNLCAYLSEDGKTLQNKPLGIWRMPTVQEVAGSLSLHNQNARCTWKGETGKMDCALNPDKETPLWAPDEPPVYYWTADQYDQEDAYYVSYTGWVSHQPKDWGNPRHGYRCVKEP